MSHNLWLEKLLGDPEPQTNENLPRMYELQTSWNVPCTIEPQTSEQGSRTSDPELSNAECASVVFYWDFVAKRCGFIVIIKISIPIVKLF